MRKKLIVMVMMVFIAIIGLIFRIVSIQITKGSKYQKKVMDQQEYSSQIIPYKRGDIVDRNYTILATSTDVYNVVLDCKVLNAKPACVEPTIAALLKCFELSEADIRTALKEKPKSQYYILKKKVEYDVTKEFRAMQKEKGSNITGVWFEKEYKRIYPYNSRAASLIGFTTTGNEGINGLEKYYNDILNGTDGREYGYLDSDNDYEKTVINANDGKTIVSTIDLAIQSIVEKKIAKFNEERSNQNGKRLGSKNTGVLVMNPNTGEILAMANYPTFDLNNPRDLSGVYSQKKINELTEEQKLDRLNRLWTNFCTTYTYEPGSTAKPFTVAMGIDSGKLKGNEKYICNGYEKVGGHTIHCVNTSGHGKETIEKAINNSCNDALMQIGRDIGITTFTKYQAIFGFGRKTGIDLPGEARTDSLVFTIDTMTPTDLATNSFGQNFNVTMIQQASGFCSLINGGNYYKPHTVKEILNADGTTYKEVEPLLVRQTISKETSSYIRKYMYTTVNEGTARSAKVDGYTMGGKTGTAEKLPRDHAHYLVSFMGFAPAANPEVVIYVVIDEPNEENQAQSSLATNLAKDILTEVLPYMNIYPDEGKDEAVPMIDKIEENYTQGIFGD